MTSMYVRSMLVGTFTFGLLACAGDPTTPTDMETASIQLDLTKQAPSGNTYRLGPATFDISGPTTLALDASGDEPVLHVPVEPGDYEVTLRSGWALQLLDPEGDPTPIVATLTSPALQFVRVEPFRSTPLNFAFHLGESGIDIGIDIEEGVPPGFDGMISPLGDGRFIITFASGGGACCFDSVSEAQQAYPGMTLFVSPS
ncbi:MAG: hypothetical protein RL685_2970 [Pseudomonadota bacterium]